MILIVLGIAGVTQTWVKLVMVLGTRKIGFRDEGLR